MYFIVIGGGWYGSLHTRQLCKAVARGKTACDGIIVVDRDPACAAAQEFAGNAVVRLVTADWLAFLGAYFPDGDTHADDHIVPAPFAPHLAFDWLVTSVQTACPGATLTRGAFDLELGLPFEKLDAQGNRYLSAADWVCPVTCIEPATCPAIRGPRTWELGDLLATHATPEQGYTGLELFTCRHAVYGIGTIPAARLLEARAHVLEALARRQPQRIAVATVSSCHGVVATLHALPAEDAIAPPGCPH
ncbi:MAG: hypothetical protein HY689_05515 [Chloroflexi bacterium]|nr:hypothetical protein [Chloroflexota bacterium]